MMKCCGYYEAISRAMASPVQRRCQQGNATVQGDLPNAGMQQLPSPVLVTYTQFNFAPLQQQRRFPEADCIYGDSVFFQA